MFSRACCMSLHERIAGRFALSEPRSRVRVCVRAVSGLERKNGDAGEWAGAVRPTACSGASPVGTGVDGVRDDVRAYVWAAGRSRTGC